jgi:hypothetical protein
MPRPQRRHQLQQHADPPRVVPAAAAWLIAAAKGLPAPRYKVASREARAAAQRRPQQIFISVVSASSGGNGIGCWEIGGTHDHIDEARF